MASSFYTKMKYLQEEFVGAGNEEGLGVLKSLQEFAVRGEFSSYKKASEFSRCLFAGMGEDQISSMMGITASTVRIHRRNLSNELYSLLGSDFFDMAIRGNDGLLECKRRLFLAKKGRNLLGEYIPFDCQNYIYQVNRSNPSLVEDGITLKDCKAEASFLITHSKQSMEAGASTFDISKLMYLLDLLAGKRGTVEERFVFTRMMDKLLEGRN